MSNAKKDKPVDPEKVMAAATELERLKDDEGRASELPFHHWNSEVVQNRIAFLHTAQTNAMTYCCNLLRV